MDEFHRTPTDPVVDRLASLRTHSTTTPIANNRLRYMVFSSVIVVVVVTILVLVTSRDQVSLSTSPQEIGTVSPEQTQSNRPELLANEAFVSFVVREGNFPTALKKNDVVRIVVTPALDGSGEFLLIDQDFKVTDVVEMSEMNNDIVLTVLGHESLLKTIAQSGPIHVAQVEVSGVSK